MCNQDILGDEYHGFLKKCIKPDIMTLQQRFIPRYYTYKNPSMLEFIKLLKSADYIKIGKMYFHVHQKCKIA